MDAAPTTSATLPSGTVRVVNAGRRLRIFVRLVRTAAMVSRDTRETALLVALGVVGFVAASAAGAPDAVAFGILVVVGGVGPLVRDEWRRQGA